MDEKELNSRAPDFDDISFNFYVENADNAASFYCRIFGFQETFRTPSEGKADHIEVKKGVYTIGFATFEAAKVFHDFEVDRGQFQGEMVLWTKNVDQTFDYLVQNNVQVISKPHDFLNTLRSAWFKDPFGINIQIVSKINQKGD